MFRILNDERLVSGSLDNNIIIYNKLAYEPDIIIKDHKGSVYYLTKLSNGILASCSKDKTIKLFIISGNNYKALKTMNYHEKEVFKVIELKNQNLVSCSCEQSIIFFMKDKSTVFILSSYYKIFLTIF